jgi:hypothetical protein
MNKSVHSYLCLVSEELGVLGPRFESPRLSILLIKPLKWFALYCEVLDGFVN